jgi:hypothetical protein
MKIRHKIHLFTTVWLVLIVCVINTSIYWLFYKLTTDRELERLQLQAETIAETMHATLANEIEPEELLQAYVTPIGMIRVVNGESRAILTAVKEVSFRNLQPAYSDSETYRLVEQDGVTYAVAQIPMIWSDGSVVSLEVTTSLADTQETMGLLLVVLLVASLVVLLPSFFCRQSAWESDAGSDQFDDTYDGRNSEPGRLQETESAAPVQR